MIPGIICIVTGVIFLWVASLFDQKKNSLERGGIPTVGTVTGIETLEGGDIQFEVSFTDHNGVARTGRSQSFDRTYGRYQLGDSISIRYQIVKPMGIEAVRLRVQDPQMKQGGKGPKILVKAMGVICIVLGVILVVLI